ncbi:MAG: heavy-metal-associated domain-containing protein [Flavobacteriales bacterium]
MRTTIKITTLLFMIVTACTFAHGQETVQTNERKYVKVEVDGLACPFCAYGLEKKLKKIEGQKDLFIEIQEGYATFNVPADNEITKEKLNKIVEDAGFTARKVTFSDKPFDKLKKDEK